MVNTLLNAANLFIGFVSVLPVSLIAFFNWVLALVVFIAIVQFIRGWIG